MPENKQEELEREQERLGRERYWSNTRKLKAAHKESVTKPGSIMLYRATEPFEKAMKEWLVQAEKAPGKNHAAYPFLTLLPLKHLVSISAEAIIDSISYKRKLTAAAIKIAGAVERECRLRELKDEHPDLFDILMRLTDDEIRVGHKTMLIFDYARRAHDIVVSRWPRKDKIRVGNVLLEQFRLSTGLIDIFKVRSHNSRLTHHVSATQEMVDWVAEAHRRNESLFPVYLPMLEEPRDWETNYFGGYRTDLSKRKPLMRGIDPHQYDSLIKRDMPKVFKAVNILQKTRWAVNKPIVDIIRELWESGSTLGGIPASSLRPYPSVPENINEDEDVKRQYALEKATVRARNNREAAHRIVIARLLSTASKYQDSAFYYPYQVDFRGRVYPVPQFLQPQGADWAKAMLMFDEGKPLDTPESIRWFKRHGANTWGLGRRPFKEREEWVDQNHGMIKAIAKDPVVNAQWAEASDPFQFLAWCMECAEWLHNPRGFLNRVPIAMDGTTNGLQIISLLMRDDHMGEVTNCVPLDSPDDMYQRVADRTTQLLENDPTDIHINWLKIGISRDMVKTPVMVVPFSGSYGTVLDMVQKWWFESIQTGAYNPFDTVRKPCSHLARVLWQAIKIETAGAIRLMEWFRSISKEVISSDKSLKWTTPSGFVVHQGYRKIKKKEVATALGNKIRYCSYQEADEGMSVRKNNRALTANFVHSLDSSLMMLTVLEANLNSLSMVHDSFATHAADAETLSRVLRKTASEMFGKNLLATFRNEVQLLVPDKELPAVPELGTLDPTNLKEAEYFFS